MLLWLYTVCEFATSKQCPWVRRTIHVKMKEQLETPRIDTKIMVLETPFDVIVMDTLDWHPPKRSFRNGKNLWRVSVTDNPCKLESDGLCAPYMMDLPGEDTSWTLHDWPTWRGHFVHLTWWTYLEGTLRSPYMTVLPWKDTLCTLHDGPTWRGHFMHLTWWTYLERTLRVP